VYGLDYLPIVLGMSSETSWCVILLKQKENSFVDGNRPKSHTRAGARLASLTIRPISLNGFAPVDPYADPSFDRPEGELSLRGLGDGAGGGGLAADLGHEVPAENAGRFARR
jgi:hypothetical protein